MTRKATTPKLTVTDIEAAYQISGGYGYLGSRRAYWTGPSTAERIAKADQVVLDAANAKGWDREALDAWLDSNVGRHFADEAFFSGDAVNWPILVRRYLDDDRLIAEIMSSLIGNRS